jgi:general stress protein 26
MSGSLEQRDKFWDLLTDFSDCMLVTKFKDSERLHARPMAPRVSKDRRQILFITDKNAAKMDEVDSYDQVALTFSKPGKWVSVSGTGKIMTDKDLISAIWDKQMEMWMPQSKDDPNVAVLAVDPERAEYWDVTATKATQAWEFAAAYMGMKDRLTCPRMSSWTCSNSREQLCNYTLPLKEVHCSLRAITTSYQRCIFA